MRARPQRARVVIAGAGVAGLEAALALRAFAPDRAAVLLIDSRERFRLAATATGRAFGTGSGVDLPLSRLAAGAGAGLRAGRLVAVDPARQVAMLAGGELVTYDALVVAVGARAEAPIAEALTFTGHGEAAEVRALVDAMAATAARGGRTDLAIVVPEGCGWPLPAYELALLTRAALAERGHRDPGRITVVTAEAAPLALFGPGASEQVAESLLVAGIEVRAGCVVRDWAWGRLQVVGAHPLPADRVIALPTLRGPAIEGLPSDARGFVRSAPDGGVSGVPDVWAVGDAGGFPVKQGGIACQQADAAAVAIARRLGAEVGALPFEPVLRGWMWDGAGGTFLRADLRGGCEESPGRSDADPLWWPVAKVAGRFLAPFLQGAPEPALADLAAGPRRRRAEAPGRPA
jgi:sulfide:quinone oxidoreductase